MTYLTLKFVHVLGAIIILGTGSGIAFFMLMAHLSRDPAYIARTASTVVRADKLFTATAVVVQPLTGYLLLVELGIPATESWVTASIMLFVVAGLCWLPVVWIQMKMRDLSAQAVAMETDLPRQYNQLFRAWLLLGFPGFGSVLLIVWLMIAKPSF